MRNEDYLEILNFQSGNVFKVSKQVNCAFINKLHWHPYVEILLSLSDRNKVSCNFMNYDMGVNDILIVYPGDLHSIIDCECDSMYVIQFPSQLLTIVDELNNHMPRFYREPFLKYDPCSVASEFLVMMLKEFCDTAESGAPFREVMMYSILLKFYARMGSRLRAQEEKTPENTGMQTKALKKIAEACIYISQNCTQPLTLESVAEHTEMSVSHFAHLFKEYTNTTFVGFLTKERILLAQRMFMNPDRQIIDIAFDSGFTSISTFNRAFKKIVGLSPSQFRETMLEGHEMEGSHPETD